MKPAPRFWPLAALILLPVLVLAGVAAFGLAEWRHVALAEAARLCNAGQFAGELMGVIEKAARESPDVVLFDQMPLPSTVTAEERELNAAVQAGDIKESERIMRCENIGHASSGLPLQALAGWQWMQARLKSRPASGESASDREAKAALQLDAERLVRLVTLFEPSVLSIVIIERLAGYFPTSVTAWRTEWRRSEARRAALRTASRQNPVVSFRTRRAVVLREIAPEFTGGPDDAVPRRVLAGPPPAAPQPATGSVAVVFPQGPGKPRVLLEHELRAAFYTVQQRTSSSLPDWAAVSIHFRPPALDGHVPSPEVFMGEDIGEVLYVTDVTYGRVESGAREKGWLLRAQSRVVAWVVAIIGTAFLTALRGLWLVRRTLHKERRLGELKSQFVSSVSHELRAPVGSLRLMADGLASGKVSGAAADEFHRLMAGEGARLSSLIENVLDFARIEQGRKQYHFAETDIAALAQDAVKLMSPPAEARGLKIETQLEPLPFVPLVDAGALQQALINLLDNAIKFSAVNAARHSNVESPPHSTLECRATGEEDTIHVALAADPSRNSWSLTVTDHGPGIPREEHARIFERFYRLGDELRRETTGTGIGLAIVKHVVEGHGGRVYVKSEIGSGSEFRMEFPERLKDEG